jgi:hypothetical protein
VSTSRAWLFESTRAIEFKFMRFRVRPSSFRCAQPSASRSCEALEERQMLTADAALHAPGALQDDAIVAAPQVADIQIQPMTGDVLVGQGAGFVAPATASAAAGNYVVVWFGPESQAENAPKKLFAQRFDAVGGAVGQRIIVRDALVSQVQVAMAADGRFVVAWSESSAVVNNILPRPLYVQRFDAAGAKQGDVILVSQESTFPTSLSINNNGEFVVGFTISDTSPPTPEEIASGLERVPKQYAQAYTSAGAPRGNRVLFGDGFNVQLAVAPNGGYAVISVPEIPSTGKPLYVELRNADGSQRISPIRISWLDGRMESPRLAMDGAGNFVVTWARRVSGGSEIRAQRFDANGSILGASVKVNSNGDGALPLLDVAADGSFVVGWSPTRDGVAPTETDRILWLRAFDAGGQPRGPAIQAGLGVTHDWLASATIGLSDTGELAATWLKNPNTSTPEIHAAKFDVLGAATLLAIDLNGEPNGVDYKSNYTPGGQPTPLADTQKLVIRGATQIASAKLTINGFLAGDQITFTVQRAGISSSFAGGVLTLTGSSTAANYEAVLRGLRFSTTAARAVGTTVTISIIVNDGTDTSDPALSKISIHVPGRSSIAGRRVFYNNSSFDGNNIAGNAADNNAIAADKVALLPNQTATFANYTSFTGGLNGIMVDLAGAHGTIEADDFIFRVGNSNDPSTWGYAPAPTAVVVRAGAGAGGSDRVHIVWEDGAIKNAWLQVIVLDNGDTGLAAPDIFMFGNQVGESGDKTGDTRVGAADIMRVVNRLLSNSSRTATIDSPIDFNRDGQISVPDMMAALNHALSSEREIALININPQGAMNGAIITGGLVAMMSPTITRPIQVVDVVNAQPQTAAFDLWQPDDDELQMLALEATAPQLLLDLDEC